MSALSEGFNKGVESTPRTNWCGWWIGVQITSLVCYLREWGRIGLKICYSTGQRVSSIYRYTQIGTTFAGGVFVLPSLTAK